MFASPTIADNTTLTVNQLGAGGTQNVFLRGIITIDTKGNNDDTDDRTWTYNQYFPFQMKK